MLLLSQNRTNPTFGVGEVGSEGSDGFARYLLLRRHITPSSARDYERRLRRLERLTGKHRTQVDALDLEDFLERDLSWSTKNQSLVAFRLYYRWAIRRQLREPDPEIEEIQVGRRVQAETVPLTVEQARTLLAVAHGPVQRRVVHVPLYGGLRFSELMVLEADNWIENRAGDWKLDFVGKGGKRRKVPVHPRLQAVRDEILSVSPTRRQLLTAVTEVREESGLWITTRTERRTFAEMLSEGGVERDVIGDVLGHSPTSVTAMHYAPPRWGEDVDAIGRLPY